MKKIDLKSVLIGLLVGTNLMFLLGAKQQEDLIVTKAIKLINDDGKQIAFLGTGDDGDGLLVTFNSDGKETAFLGTGDDGDGLLVTSNSDGKETAYLGTGKGGGGGLRTSNSDGKETAYLGTGESGDGGFLRTHNADGKQTAYLGGGHLTVYNKTGEMVGYFGSNKDNDGIARLYDRYGDIGWGMSGKK